MTEPYRHRNDGRPDPFEDARGRAERRMPPAGGPVFNGVPAVILALCGLIVGFQALDSLSLAAGGGLHVWLWSQFAVITGAPEETGIPAGGASSLALMMHVFVHGGWLHAGMNTAALLAFGAAAARPFGQGAFGIAGFLAFFFTCAVCGALTHLATQGQGASVMVGASTAVSGVLAAAGYARGGRAGMMQLAVPWALINAAMAVTGLFAPLPIAWGGHLGGLAGGVIFYPLFLAVFGRFRRRF